MGIQKMAMFTLCLLGNVVAYGGGESPAYQAQAPAYQAPAPAYQAPAPAYQAPAYQAPAYPAPVYKAPVSRTIVGVVRVAPTVTVHKITTGFVHAQPTVTAKHITGVVKTPSTVSVKQVTTSKDSQHEKILDGDSVLLESSSLSMFIPFALFL